MLGKFWYETGGCYYNKPGKVRVAICGICRAKMKVERNVLAHTCFAEAMAGKKRRVDFFFCPRSREDWHKQIEELKMDVQRESISAWNNPIQFKKMKRAAKKEILNLLRLVERAL